MAKISTNSVLYQEVSAESPPVTLANMKSYLKVTDTIDDFLITSFILTATEWGEAYTGRGFRNKVWKALLDCFETRILLRRDVMDAITQITRLVLGTPMLVDSSVFYLKKLTYWGEVLLQDGQIWPTDQDSREQGIVIDFTTSSFNPIGKIQDAIKRTVAFMYENRGDCSELNCDQAALECGALLIFKQLRIPRI